MPHRERYLFVCTNHRDPSDPRGSCGQKGSEAIQKALKAKLKELGVADRIRACTSGCIDMCETGVSVAVEPDHVIYGGVRLEDVNEIAESIAEGTIVDHLVVAAGSLPEKAP